MHSALIMLLLVASALHGQNLETAKTYEAAGETDKAFAEYQQWLADNTGSSEYLEVALRAGDLIAATDTKVAYLAELSTKITDPPGRYEVLKKLATLEELIGRLGPAQQHFIEASFAIPEKKDFSCLLRSANLLFELGEYRSAEVQAQAIVETCKIELLVMHASTLLSRVYYVTDRVEHATALSLEMLVDENITPGALLWLYKLGGYTAQVDVSNRALSLLRERYPESVEASLLEGGVDYLPAPSLFLGPKPKDESPNLEEEAGTSREESEGGEVEADSGFSEEDILVSIQTGSFSVLDNAEYAIKDLKTAGFAAVIRQKKVNDTLYYRVLIPEVPSSTVAEVILLLKEKGFEGFPLYDRD